MSELNAAGVQFFLIQKLGEQDTGRKLSTTSLDFILVFA